MTDSPIQPTPPGENGGQSPVDDGGEGTGNAIQEIGEIIFENEPLLLGLILLGAGAVAFYRKYDRRVHEEYDEKDWDEIIVNDLKFVLSKAGLQVDKKLTRGDSISLGDVYSYDQFSMPKEYDYEELMFQDESDLDEDDFSSVHIFLVAPTGLQNTVWKFTDLWLNQNMNTMMYIVESDKVTEEEHRFKLDQDIDFKREHGSIMVQKGTATENMTNQQPIYSAKKNIVQGIDEFTEKTLFLDRSHTREIAKIREEADADTDKMLQQLRGH